MEEVQAVRGQVSRSTGRPYPLTVVCQVLRISRSSVYAAQAPPGPSGPPRKRGPKTRWGDAAVVAGIRAVLAASPFHGEGYRKIRARLAHRGRELVRDEFTVDAMVDRQYRLYRELLSRPVASAR